MRANMSNFIKIPTLQQICRACVQINLLGPPNAGHILTIKHTHTHIGRTHILTRHFNSVVSAKFKMARGERGKQRLTSLRMCPGAYGFPFPYLTDGGLHRPGTMILMIMTMITPLRDGRLLLATTETRGRERETPTLPHLGERFLRPRTTTVFVPPLSSTTDSQRQLWLPDQPSPLHQPLLQQPHSQLLPITTFPLMIWRNSGLL